MIKRMIILLASLLLVCAACSGKQEPEVPLMETPDLSDYQEVNSCRIHLPFVASGNDSGHAEKSVESASFEESNHGVDASEQGQKENVGCQVEVKTINISTGPPVQLRKREFCGAVEQLGFEDTRFIIWWYDQVVCGEDYCSATARRELMPEVGVVQLSLNPPGNTTSSDDWAHIYNQILNHELAHFKETDANPHGDDFGQALGLLSAGSGTYKYQMFEAASKASSNARLNEPPEDVPLIKGASLESKRAEEIMREAEGGADILITSGTVLYRNPGRGPVAWIAGAFAGVSYGEAKEVADQRYVKVQLQSENMMGWVATR